MTHDRDAALVARMAGGDSAALQDLYRRLSPLAYALALRITGNEADAEEALVDCFHQAWRQAARYDPARATPTGWILNIARSRAIDRVRSRDRAAEGAAPAPGGWPGFGAEPPPDPEQEAIRHDVRDRLARAVGGLPREQRSVIELAYFLGLTQSEIAARLGEPLGTVKTRTRLALEKIRNALDRVEERRR